MNANDLQKWTINSSKYLVDDKFMRLRLDSCTTPQGGKIDKYYVIEYNDWVNCLAIDTDNNAITLRHYRHGVRSYLSELVAGGIEPEDASPEVAARRELEEETGYTGGKLYNVGVSYPNPASQTNKLYSFLAVGGSLTHEQNLEAGESLLVEKVPFQTFLDQLYAPEAIQQSLHIATVFFVLNFIRRSSDPAIQELKKLMRG